MSTADVNSARIEQLWRQHADELMRLATVMVGPASAADVVSETFIRAAPRAASGEVDNPRAYLFRAVHHRAIDQQRSETSRRARESLDYQRRVEDPVEDHSDVRAAVAQLSESQRAVVYLTYWEDQPERQVAELLGLSPGTVHRTLERARESLRGQLADLAPSDLTPAVIAALAFLVRSTPLTPSMPTHFLPPTAPATPSPPAFHPPVLPVTASPSTTTRSIHALVGKPWALVAVAAVAVTAVIAVIALRDKPSDSGEPVPSQPPASSPTSVPAAAVTAAPTTRAVIEPSSTTTAAAPAVVTTPSSVAVVEPSTTVVTVATPVVEGPDQSTPEAALRTMLTAITGSDPSTACSVMYDPDADRPITPDWQEAWDGCHQLIAFLYSVSSGQVINHAVPEIYGSTISPDGQTATIGQEQISEKIAGGDGAAQLKNYAGKWYVDGNIFWNH